MKALTILLLLLASAPVFADTPVGPPGSPTEEVITIQGHPNMTPLQIAGSVSVSTQVTTSEGVFDETKSTVVVSAGSGFYSFTSTGTINSCSIVPPVGATYGFEVETDDADAFPVMGRTAISGRASLFGPVFVRGPHKVRIVSASIDGNYRVKCVIKR